MHYLLHNYILAKYKTQGDYCSCPNCIKQVVRKSENHVFCCVECKDRFWNKVKGKPAWFQNSGKRPVYPDGYEQWKKDLAHEESIIASNILLGLDERTICPVKKQ